MAGFDADDDLDLKEARKTLGLSQQALAVEIGTHASTVADWEQKGSITPVAKRLILRMVAEKIAAQSGEQAAA